MMYMYNCKSCDCAWGSEKSEGNPRICPKCRTMTKADLMNSVNKEEETTPTTLAGGGGTILNRIV